MAFPSMTRRPKVAFLGVKVLSSPNASAASPDIISPGPNDSLEDADFFFFIIELDRPIVDLLTDGPALVSFPPFSLSSWGRSSYAMLWRNEDFLKDFLTRFELDMPVVARVTLSAGFAQSARFLAAIWEYLRVVTAGEELCSTFEPPASSSSST
jgi:hypothetical protein